MGFRIKHQLEVSIQMELPSKEFVEFPASGLSALSELNITESTKFNVPLLYLHLEDALGFFKECPLVDGTRVRITILCADAEFIKGTFRVFNHHEVYNGTCRTVKLDAYLDVPMYWFVSSCQGYRGSSSMVISQIAGICGLTAEVDSTQDSQLWMQGNRTYANFVSYLTKYGYGGAMSFMMSGLRFDSTLVYKDVNALKDEGLKVSTYVASDGMYLATDFTSSSNSGLNNSLGGYAALMQDQRILSGGDVTTKDLNVKVSEQHLNVNSDVLSIVKRSSVEHSHLTVDANPSLWKGVYQNTRYAKVYTVDCSMIIAAPTQLTLLKPFILSATMRNGESDTRSSGKYIVDTRCIIIKGIRYGERISATRVGMN